MIEDHGVASPASKPLVKSSELDVPAGEGLASLGSASDEVAALFLAEREPEEVLQVSIHELTTDLLNDRATGAPALPWLEEGVATELAFNRLGSNGGVQLGTLAEGKGAETL